MGWLQAPGDKLLLIHRWEMFALNESCLCTLVLLVRVLPAVLASNSRLGGPAYDISIPQGEF